jgi:hypothetical protein
MNKEAYARATRGKWKVISSIKKRAKELQKREAELTTTAAQWAKRGERHRELVFGVAHGPLARARLKQPHTFREAKLADDMARKADSNGKNGSCQLIRRA